MTTNAIYTPTPKTLPVFVLTLKDGRKIVKATADRDVVVDGLDCWAVSVERCEAPVTARGNLHGNDERWFEVEVAGTRHWVLGEGS